MANIIHKVKINEEFAMLHHRGLKPWELRENDRNYKVGDVIEFGVMNRLGNCIHVYQRKITYMFEGGQYGLEKGYCIITLKEV